MEAALVTSGAAAFARRRRHGDILVLAYHNIVPTGAEVTGDRSLHLPQASFAAQLDALADTHDIVPLYSAVSNARRSIRTSKRPVAAITFDDAYSGAMTAGIAELRARDLPATIFVTPGLLDGGTFWWDVLADTEAGLDAVTRERGLTDGRGLGAAIIASALRDGATTHPVPDHARGASNETLHAALDHAGITFAAHTWNHPNLTAISENELADELVRPLEWLEQFRERAIPMVSYPYGLSNAKVRGAARRAGYEFGFMIDGGWSAAVPPDAFSIPRVNIPAGVTRQGFVLRAAGLFTN